MKRLSRLIVSGYRASIRLRSKSFSLLISGAFARFGRKTVLMYPLRLVGKSGSQLTTMFSSVPTPGFRRCLMGTTSPLPCRLAKVPASSAHASSPPCEV